MDWQFGTGKAAAAASLAEYGIGIADGRAPQKWGIKDEENAVTMVIRASAGDGGKIVEAENAFESGG